MHLEDEIKIITKEPSLVIARFGLGQSYIPRSEILDRVREVMDFRTKQTLGRSHPYFNNTSLHDSLRGPLSALVEGSEEEGFRIRHLERNVVAKVDFGIHTVVTSGISLDHAFGGPLSAENVAKILYALRDGSTKRIQDICDETGIHFSVPGKHLVLLAEMGVVDFQGYESPRFHWNPDVKSFDCVVERIKKYIPFEASNYRVQRAIEVAHHFYNKRTMDFDLTQAESLIAGRFASGGYNRNITAGALRNLERMGYLIASNVFVRGDIQTQVRAVFDAQGRNSLIDFVVAIKGEKDVPPAVIGYEEAREAIDI